MNNEIESKLEKADTANNDLFRAINRQFDSIEDDLDEAKQKIEMILKKLNINND